MKNIMTRSIVALLLVGTSASALSQIEKRPFRTSFEKFSPELDWQKPTGLADYAGWVSNADYLVGSYSDDWTVAKDTRDNSVRWWLANSARLSTEPLIFGGWVILAHQNGELRKVELATGKILWTNQLSSFVSRPMIIQGGNVFVVTAKQKLFSVNFLKGSTNWVYDGGSPSGLVARNQVKPLIHKGGVLLGLASGYIHKVDTQSGKLMWRFSVEKSHARFSSVIGEFLVYENGVVFARYDGVVAAIDIKKNRPKKIWMKKLPSVSAISARGDKFFLGCVNGDVYSMNLVSGTVNWRYSSGVSVENILIGEKQIYLSNVEGKIVSVRSKNGQEVWADDLGGMITSKPFYRKDELVFVTSGRNFYGFRVGM